MAIYNRLPKPPRWTGSFEIFINEMSRWFDRLWLQWDRFLAYGIITVQKNYTLLNTDFTVLVDTSLGERTITLPLVASCAVGQIFEVKHKTGGNNLILAGMPGETIDDEATVTLYPYETLTVQTDGTDWWII